MALRLVVFGTPAFAVPTLERLAASAHPVVAVVTQPDRAQGRGHRVQPPAVKVAALAAGLPVLQPDRLKDEALVGALRSLEPHLAVVAAYGKMIPGVLLALPRLGTINVHASLLPRWRGAAPVHRAILDGDDTTGVTIMRVVAALDAGPMLARSVVPIGLQDTSGALEGRLAAVGAALVGEVVDRLASGPVPEEPQDERLVTYARRLERRDSPVDWHRPALAVHNQIRGLQPWPQASTHLRGRRILLRRSDLVDGHPGGPAGTIVAADASGLVVATGTGAIRILELQSEGRAPMGVEAWIAGHPVQSGDRFDVAIDGPP